MMVLASLALLLLPLGLDVCDSCHKGKVCKAHAKLEKTEIARLRPKLKSEEVDVRLDALDEIAALTYEHENVPSSTVAKALLAGLKDPSLRVRERAIRLLTDGQHPETAVKALVSTLEGFKKNMGDLVPWLAGQKGKGGTTADAMHFLKAALRVSGDVPDDRVVKALVDVLLAMPEEMRGQPAAMMATHSLLQLGTRDAVNAVLRQFNSQPDGPGRRKIHDALTGLAGDLEIEDTPVYGKDAHKQWARWMKRHNRSLPAKLGKWRGPPVEDEEEDDKAVLAPT